MHASRTLADVIDKHGGVIQTGPFGTQLHQSDYTEEGVPVVMPKDIINGRVDESTVARISEEKAAQLSRHFLKEGDIVFPRRGEISKCALIKEDQSRYFCGTGCLKIQIPKNIYSPKFLYYYLGLRQSVEWLEKNAVGTTMLNLSAKIIGGLPMPMISLAQQERITSILSAYDELIENNRRRIQLLEQAARLLYKEWFVHLRFPGHEHTKIKNGIPEGWEKKSLGNLVEIKKGKNITKDTAIQGNVPVVAGGLNPSYFHNRANVTGPVMTISASGANSGFVNLYHQDIWASDCSYISHEDTEYVYYYFLLLKSRQIEIFGLQKGAAQPHVYPKDLMRLSVNNPPHTLLQIFEGEVARIFRMISNLNRQNKALANARNLLLPRLMNGEIVM